jgi:hypothetical protein
VAFGKTAGKTAGGKMRHSAVILWQLIGNVLIGHQVVPISRMIPPMRRGRWKQWASRVRYPEICLSTLKHTIWWHELIWIKVGPSSSSLG